MRNRRTTLDWRDCVTVDPEVCHGRACIAGTRVPVTTVLGNLAAGIMQIRANEERSPERYFELKRILEERRLEIIGEVQSKMRQVRDEDAVISRQHVRDEAEARELEVQDDIGFALLQMKAETLEKIGEALERLEQGRYGRCYECGAEIAGRRLRALPFAVRCKNCEEVRACRRPRPRHGSAVAARGCRSRAASCVRQAARGPHPPRPGAAPDPPPTPPAQRNPAPP